ncbi:MAG: DUF4465 domain-containing protein [Phycisphaerales bacterium]|nr:DUF4465 domain-containing protein [Phycisphaerales bacterium]
MRKLLLSLSVGVISLTTNAQGVSNFDSLKLSKKDTAYINHSMPGKDVGFYDSLAYFPCVYDTSDGYHYWSYGFAYSNWTDSVKSGYTNQYSAKTAKGFAGSNNYVVSYGNYNVVRLKAPILGKALLGCYVTNSTFAYNSMRDGDAFAKKFKAKDKDFFRLDVFGYYAGTLTKDSVSFYLADFRNTDTTQNYIVRDWQWVNLAKLGKVDSVMFRLQSSDNGSFGMNTPSYFCMDNFMTNETGLSIPVESIQADIKVYPNPTSNILFVESSIPTAQQVLITDVFGRAIESFEFKNSKLEIHTDQYAPGVYVMTFRNAVQITTTRFVKQ